VGHPVKEDHPPDPIELYGRSKLEAERVVQTYANQFPCTIVRTPTIIDEGRLGLLTILFDFIRENRRVWVVGQGDNRYQFLYAPDLADACIRASESGRGGTFNVGSDNVGTLRETFEEVIRSVGSRSRVGKLPKSATLLAMRLAHAAGMSPLGPYHYRMIAESFEFDTSHARETLGWRPTLTGSGMLSKACLYYLDHHAEIHARRSVSPHRKAADLGAIRLLKWLS
jgi:nucleoside-diphosphate-sugar epimerase